MLKQLIKVLLLCFLIACYETEAFDLSSDSSSSITISSLPAEARLTLHLIKKGGPFPLARDGVVFGNYEHFLPRQRLGYYHEYTVKTPGIHDRGARRIVCGTLLECYYSSDHYKSFQRIEE